MTALRRLFFALWPSDRLRDVIVERFERSELQAALGGRRVPAHNLHLTLVFLGNVPGERVEDLIDGAGRIEGTGRCALHLDRFGVFPEARVAWLGAEPEPSARRLVEALRQCAADTGIPVDERPWTPHVTLLRRIEARSQRVIEGGSRPHAAIEWPVATFSLIESIPSTPYQVLRTWPVE